MVAVAVRRDFCYEDERTGETDRRLIGWPFRSLSRLGEHMPTTGSRVAKLLPPPGLARSLSIQSVISSTGAGCFTTGSAVFFLNVLGLTPRQVGIGFSIAGAISLISAVPLSALADRFGGRRTWNAGTVVNGFLFLAYPSLRGFWAFLGILTAMTIASSVASAGRMVYTIDALPKRIGSDRWHS